MELTLLRPLIQPLIQAFSPVSEYLFARYPILAQLAERDDLVSLVFTLGALLLLLMPVFTPRTKFGLPIVGYRSIFEPSWLLKLRFIRNSRGILKEGYDKVRADKVACSSRSSLINTNSSFPVPRYVRHSPLDHRRRRYRGQ